MSQRRHAYDYLIVGAGWTGATLAHELKQRGKRVLVLEKDRVGGAAATEMRDGVMVNLFGGHIFHTNDKRLWDYVNRFGEWRPYLHRVKAVGADGELHSLPINLNTLHQMFGVREPLGARDLLQGFAAAYPGKPSNAEEWCLQHIGVEMYHALVQGYTRKQWGKDPSELPASIVQRLPIRTTWEDNYFTDTYQGMPVLGYTEVIRSMLKGIPLVLEDYLDRSTYWNEQADQVLFTGPVDALMGYQLGRLEYRSLRWEWERREVPDAYGVATVNFCSADLPYTRVMEWKHFYPAPGTAHTILAWEFPEAYEPGKNEALYPVNDERNMRLYRSYCEMMRAQKPQVKLAGRQGAYRYWDMHQAIAAALELADRLEAF